MQGILPGINSPADLKKLSSAQLKQLCGELRDYMIECCAVHPGHLGSSLGAVELIVGLHYVLDAPKDNIVFDVSHQAYAHKILTGRREAFRTLRCKDGLSGFTKRDESPYDAFGAGHSSTSISAAFGLAEAARLRGDNSRTVALIGDGALSGGMAFEALNCAGDSSTDLLVIVNDNNMSIDRNIGALHRYLLQLTTDPFYNIVKNKVWNALGDTSFRKRLQNFVVHRKSNVVQHSGGDLFEALGFRYFGPVDGNDIDAVVNALSRLKDLHGPRVLHTITKKGKGYAPAEEAPTTWHAPGQFDPETGERIKGSHPCDRYQDVFGKVLLDLAKKDPRIVGITPAMASGCGMNLLASHMPDRFYDVGIAEEHAVTFSAGLAAGGMVPFCNIYSSFAQRAFDQIIHDVALQNLHVVVCLDRAGVVGEDGPTHHGVFDMAAFRPVPGVTIAAPRNELDLKNLMYTAANTEGGPYIIRYPRGWGENVEWENKPYTMIETGHGEKLREGKDVLCIALGHCANRALEAAGMLAEKGIDTAVWDARFLKPFDRSILEEARQSSYKLIVTVEDGMAKGGLFSEVSEFIAYNAAGVKVVPVGIPDTFIPQASQKEQREECGIGASGIAGIVEKTISDLNLTNILV